MIVKAPWLMVIVGPIIEIDAPLPLEMKTPASLTTMDAPVVLRKMIPPVVGTGGMTGGGTDGGMSLTMIPCCKRDWITMLGSAGRPSCAARGTSAVEPQRHPTHTGYSGSPCSNSTQTPAPMGGTR